MQTTYWTVVLILAGGLVAAGGVAIHYRSRCADLTRDLDSALEELSKQPLVQRVSDAARAVAPAPGAEREAPAVEEPSAATAAAGDALVFSNRVRELELALGEKEKDLWALQQQATAATNRPPDRGRRDFDPRAWLAQVEKEDPERYKQIVEAREAARKRVDDAFAKKSAHLLTAQIPEMGDQEKEERDKMLTLLSATWVLSERLRSEDLPREEQREMRREVFQNMSALEPLLKAEREREFHALGETVGYEKQNTTQFVEYVNAVIDATSMQGFMGGGRGWFGPRSGTSRVDTATGPTTQPTVRPVR